MPFRAILRVLCQLHSYCTNTISVAQRKNTVFFVKGIFKMPSKMGIILREKESNLRPMT